MSNSNGIELTREIRKKFTHQNLPVIIITTQSYFIGDKEGCIKVNSTILKTNNFADKKD